MKVGSKVELLTFNGVIVSPEDCRPIDNYWLLIGATGVVVSVEDDSTRALIKFDKQVLDLGLACHNPIPNSLLILISDLEIV